MVQGLERRAATETNTDRSLRSMGKITPVSIPQTAGPAGSPRLPHVQVAESASTRIAQSLGKYGQDLLGAATGIQQKTSIMEGQMAAHQGRTFDQVEMGGDKFALEGYRLVEAQRLSSSLLVAQEQEIADGLYESDPAAYRAHFMQRAAGVLSSASDERTAELAREQLLKQIPVLADAQMGRHLAWKEQQNFDSLSNAIDTISADPTATEALISFASGDAGSATAGLSEDRRREAVTSGIVSAFENDNPAAYATLANTGMLKQYTVAQRRSIDAARRSFEQRRRNEYNAEFIKQENDLMDQVERGMEPQQAMELYADLLADHNITISAQEAGSIYSAAEAGNRDAAVTRGMLTNEALMRGDRGTAIDLITGSLTATESSGNAGAFRTNKDGRSFGGLVQMGQGRLNDYNNATGSSVTVDQYKLLNAQAQREVSDWHFNDILDQIESKGYDELVGSSIRGVEVTVSGLAAVAHLGGKEGLDKFIASGGKYNPEDELGTSLLDYLKKHGTGVMLSNAQQQAMAARSIETIREREAIDAYEVSQPLLDSADDEYRRTGDENAWRAARQEVYEGLSVERTMAQVKHEVGLMQDVRQQAEDQLDERNAISAHARTRVAEEEFEQVVERFEKGDADNNEVSAALRTLAAAREGIRTEFGLPVSASKETTQLDAQSRRLKEAMDARIKFSEGEALINRAVLSGTLDELPSDLQDRALSRARQEAQAAVQDAQASGAVSAEETGDLFNARMVDFYAQTGLVDDAMKRTINGFLSGPLLDASGAPSPAYVDAAEQYRLLSARNPVVADKYIRDENRAQLDAVLDIAAGGSIAGAVRTLGLRKEQATRLPTQDEFMNDPANMRRVNDAVVDYLKREEIGPLQAIFSSDADLQQVVNRTNFDRFGTWDAENQQVLNDRISERLLIEHRANPTLRASELVSAAARRVTERTPIVGGTAVPVPMDGPSAGEMFFGARASDFTDQANVINDVLMDHFRTDEFRAANPMASGTTFQESLPVWFPFKGESGTPSDSVQALLTGVRPFQVYYTRSSGWNVVFSLPSGGYSDAITLDARAIGNEYMQNHTAKAAN